jgi:hypothetical protein
LERFENKDNILRNRKKLIYSSNPDRGRDFLLKMFPRMLEKDPELELHIFSYYPAEIADREEFRKEIPNVHYRGYVDQETLAKEYLSSGVWVYPCT